MAGREHDKKTAPSFTPARLLIFLICAASLFLAFSLFSTSVSEEQKQPDESTKATPLPETLCDYSDGRWIYHPAAEKSPRYDHTCKEIFKGWNCIGSSKFNGVDLLKWRWK